MSKISTSGNLRTSLEMDTRSIFYLLCKNFWKVLCLDTVLENSMRFSYLFLLNRAIFLLQVSNDKFAGTWWLLLLNLRLRFPGLAGKGYMGQTGATMAQVMEDHLMKKRYKNLKAGNIPTYFQSAN